MRAPRATVKPMRTFVLTVDRTHSCHLRYLHVLQIQRLRTTKWLYRPGLDWERQAHRYPGWSS